VIVVKRLTRRDGTEVTHSEARAPQHAEADGLVHGSFKQRLDQRRQRAEELAYQAIPAHTSAALTHARKVVAGHSVDAAEGATFLAMLGLDPREPDALLPSDDAPA